MFANAFEHARKLFIISMVLVVFRLEVNIGHDEQDDANNRSADHPPSYSYQESRNFHALVSHTQPINSRRTTASSTLIPSSESFRHGK